MLRLCRGAARCVVKIIDYPRGCNLRPIDGNRAAPGYNLRLVPLQWFKCIKRDVIIWVKSERQADRQAK